jgi:hypothetical protein
MSAQDQTGETRAGAETTEFSPRQVPPPHDCETVEPRWRKMAAEEGDRRFLTALLRALSAWSA